MDSGGFKVEDGERRLGLGNVRESLREGRGFRGGGLGEMN